MTIVAYGIMGVTFCHFRAQSQTVNALYYSRTFLQRLLCRIIWEKRSKRLQHIIILRDKESPYGRMCKKNLLARRGWNVLEDPPYSSYLSICDFDLIPKLKDPLHGIRLRTHEDIVTAMRCEIRRFPYDEAEGI